MAASILYGRSEDAWKGHRRFIADLIDEHGLRSICEIGGGANPVLTQELIAGKGLEYAILDISEGELAKAPPHYRKVVADISARDFRCDTKYELVFSKMLAEHIPDAEQFHRNVFRILADNGFACHFFPTLYTLPFLVNYLTPESLSNALLRLFARRDPHRHGKFPAYYRWCRGPSAGQIRRFVDLGYQVVEYRGFFGHAPYYDRIGLLKKVHELKTDYLLKHPHPLFTSYAYVVLRKDQRSS